MAEQSSGAAFVLNRGQVSAPADKPTLPQGTLKTSDNFWKEYFRVQSDKLLMFGLIIMLHCFHAPDNLQAAAIGGLIILIQGQRFKLG